MNTVARFEKCLMVGGIGFWLQILTIQGCKDDISFFNMIEVSRFTQLHNSQKISLTMEERVSV